MTRDFSNSKPGRRLVLKSRWITFLVMSGGMRASTCCSVATASLKAMTSTVFVGRGFNSGGTSDAAGMRCGCLRAYLMQRIHSSLDPSCKLMSIWPEGMLAEAVDWSCPEMAGVDRFLCRCGALWVDEYAVGGFVEESCGGLS